MGSYLSYRNQDYRRARIEGEIQQRDLSLRKIGEDRVHLEVRLAANMTLQRMIALRFEPPGSMAGRSESRARKFG
jgi:hypothetical protein